MAEYFKILTETDVSTRLEVKSRWLNDLFPAFEAGQYDQVLVVEDENGKNWEFSLRIRLKKHKKPYISRKTWHPFVVEKQAEVGDKVVFSREADGAIGFRYKIRVIKKVMKNEEKEVKLFGAIIDYSNN